MIGDKSSRTLVMLVALIISSTLFVNASGNSFVIAEISIDGSISGGEWESAAHKVEWFMDADPENSDGYNYMYLDEDDNSLYIALDLCSDQTNNETGEWIGVWLNTNMTEVNNGPYESPRDWEAALDRGMESFVFDVDNNETMEFFHESYNTAYFHNPVNFVAVNGSLEGESSDTWSKDSVYLNATSVFNGTHYLTRVDIPIDFSTFFPVFEELFLDHVRYLRLDYNFQHNTTLSEHFLSVSDLDGNLNPSIVKSLGTGTGVIDSSVVLFPENFTSPSEVILSLNGIGAAPFKTSYDFLRIDLRVDSVNNIAEHTVLPYSSILSYNIDWSFGPSENNATEHRQFEIKIPKSELEGYEDNSDLGIIVGGYGTLISFPNTHNWVFANDTLTGIPESEWTKYNYYPMPLKTSPDSTTTTTIPTFPQGADVTLFIVIAGAGVVIIIFVVIFTRKR
ncbi:MAG: hypothetical protein ACFFF9_14625 [Candidatus Thorarchaeota archaeon]